MIYIQTFINNEEKPVDHKPLPDCYTVTSGFSFLIQKNSSFSLCLNQIYFNYKKKLKPIFKSLNQNKAS